MKPTISKKKKISLYFFFNHECLLLEQIHLLLDNKFNMISFYDQVYIDLLENNIIPNKSSVLILDLDCMTFLLNKIASKEIFLPIQIVMVLIVKKDQSIPAIMINNKRIHSAIIVPRPIEDIIESLEQIYVSNFGIKKDETIIINQNQTPEIIFIKKIKKIIISQIELGDISIEVIAFKMQMSQEKLNKKIKEISNLSTVQYILKVRLEIAKEIIENQHHSVKEVAFKTCFSSLSYFTKSFKINFGVLPSQYKLTKNAILNFQI